MTDKEKLLAVKARIEQMIKKIDDNDAKGGETGSAILQASDNSNKGSLETVLNYINALLSALKVRFAGRVYDVVDINEKVGMYGIEDELGHVDYLNMDSCEVVESGDESPLVGEEPDDRDDDTELTPFERAVEGVMDNTYHVTNEHAKNVARELLDLARAELKDEKPVSGELEEAAQEYAENHFQDFIETEDDPGYWCSRFGFIAGANWQKQEDQESIKFVEEPDLDKAAKEHAANLYGEDWMKNEHIQDNGFKAISNFKFGAGWQKEQMMKDSVNGIMDCDDDNEWIEITDKLIVTPSRAGKRVKIIIVKEEQQ